MVSFRAVLTAALALGVTAAPSGLVSRADPDAVLPQTWTVQAFPDSPLLTLTGTISEVHSQLVALNPKFDSDFPSFQAEVNAMMAGYSDVKERTVVPETKLQVEKREKAETYQVQAFLDGPIFNMTGTVEQVHSQLVVLNPNFDTDFPSFYNEMAIIQWLKQLGMSKENLSNEDSKRKTKRTLPSEWRVQAVLDGPLITLSGTIDEIHAQLLALNPNFDSDFPTFWSEIDALRYLENLDENYGQELKKKREFMERRLESRHYATHNREILDAQNYFRDVDAVCTKTELTFISYLQTAIEYFRDLDAPAPQNAPHSCGRVSCIYDSVIYWCNNNDVPLTLANWTIVGDAADRLLEQCVSKGVPYGYVAGNITHPTENWTVKSHFERC